MRWSFPGPSPRAAKGCRLYKPGGRDEAETFQTLGPPLRYGADRVRCTPSGTLPSRGSDGHTCVSRATLVQGCQLLLSRKPASERKISFCHGLPGCCPSALRSSSWSARSVAMQQVQEQVLKSLLAPRKALQREQMRMVLHATTDHNRSVAQSPQPETSNFQTPAAAPSSTLARHRRQLLPRHPSRGGLWHLGLILCPARLLQSPLNSVSKQRKREFPKIRGTLFWCPYNKDPTV